MKKSYHSSAEPIPAASNTWRKLAGDGTFASITHFRQLWASPPSDCLASFEILVLRADLVLVDRSLARRGRQRHAHRHFLHAWSVGRLARNQRLVPGGEILDPHQWRSI